MDSKQQKASNTTKNTNNINQKKTMAQKKENKLDNNHDNNTNKIIADCRERTNILKTNSNFKKTKKPCMQDKELPCLKLLQDAQIQPENKLAKQRCQHKIYTVVSIFYRFGFFPLRPRPSSVRPSVRLSSLGLSLSLSHSSKSACLCHQSYPITKRHQSYPITKKTPTQMPPQKNTFHEKL